MVKTLLTDDFLTCSQVLQLLLKIYALQAHMTILSVCLTHDAKRLFSKLIMALQWKVWLCFLVVELLHLQVVGFVILLSLFRNYDAWWTCQYVTVLMAFSQFTKVCQLSHLFP